MNWLKRDLDTRWGIYAAGTEVTVLAHLPHDRVCICLDGFHVTSWCHCVTVRETTIGTER